MSDVNSKSSIPDPETGSGLTAVQPLLPSPHAVSTDHILTTLQASRHGLSQTEASGRLIQFGRNTLPRTRPPWCCKGFPASIRQSIDLCPGCCCIVIPVDSGMVGCRLHHGGVTH